MNDQQRVSAALERLFRTYPSLGKGSTPEEISRSLAAAAQVYYEAVAPYTADDVEVAVNAFLTGTVPGHNTAFAPTAPMVGSACRRAMEKRVDAENLRRRLRPALPKPDIVHTDEERARAKALVADFVASVASAEIEQTTEEQKRRKERWEKVNARFQPAMDDASVMERLLGYSTGSPESDEFAA